MTRSALVVLYHRVTEAPDDALGLAIGAVRFAEHLDVLAEEADVVPLERIRERTPRGRAVAVTFDDGYADNVEVAAPTLAAAGLPATFFVVASDPAVEFWWDRLDHLLTDPGPLPERLDVTIAGVRLRADLRTGAGRARTLRALNHRIRPLHPDTIEAVLADIGSQLGRVAAPCERHRRATGAELRALVARPGLRVGAHGLRHPMLSSLNAAEQYTDLARGRAELEAAVGGPIDALAYPYGMAGSWDRTTERHARDLGFASACTNVVGTVTRRTHRYRIPRCQIWSCEPDELRASLRAWFAGAA